MKKDLTEKEIENAILDYLAHIPGTYWKNNTVGVYDPVKKVHRKPGKYHRNGVSDILGVDSSGRFIAIEVKALKGRLSENQKTFIDDINKHGGLAFVARSVDDVREHLLGQRD
tara:strand:- start:136 stop:474 length:339 start_codon:yes stop_codon:yes gene_type:complete